jgi:hypothetical protein
MTDDCVHCGADTGTYCIRSDGSGHACCPFCFENQPRLDHGPGFLDDHPPILLPGP